MSNPVRSKVVPSNPRQYVTMVEKQLHEKWAKIRVREAYLEHGKNIRGQEIKSWLQTRVQTAKRKPMYQVWTSHRIVFVRRVDVSQIYKLWYPEFYDIQQDGKEWNFTEADFPNRRLEDLEFMFDEFKDRTIRPKGIIDALDVLKKFMKRQIKLSTVNDCKWG